jgi:hypothetical protein
MQTFGVFEVLSRHGALPANPNPAHLPLKDVIDAHFLAIGWYDFSASCFGSGPVDTK